MKDSWIPIKLPKLGEPVLCYCKDEYIGYVQRILALNLGDDDFFWDDPIFGSWENKNREFRFDYVLAWQDLPEGYKEGK